MEADHLRENPQTPQQQETLQAITYGCKRLMRLLLAANWVQAATDMHPTCPNKKQNHLQNSLLRPIPENLLKTGFAQKGLPSCPSGRHKPQSFIETKRLRFCNLDTKNFKK